MARQCWACCFGSALKQEGIEAFLDALSSYTEAVTYPEALSAYIYKISRDASGERLVWMKLTGGNLKVKDLLDDYGKANQIRLYSGAKYEMTQEAEAGEIVAVTGLTGARVGMEIGAEAGTSTRAARLEPVLSYRLILPEDCDAAAFLPKLRELEEEEPELKVAWKEETREIQVMIDPGIGFAKSYEENLTLLRRLDILKEAGYPILLGTSRKSVIGLTLDLPCDQRLPGTIATTVMGFLSGASFFRVHDVAANKQALRMAMAIMEA